VPSETRYITQLNLEKYEELIENLNALKDMEDHEHLELVSVLDEYRDKLEKYFAKYG